MIQDYWLVIVGTLKPFNRLMPPSPERESLAVSALPCGRQFTQGSPFTSVRLRSHLTYNNTDYTYCFKPGYDHDYTLTNYISLPHLQLLPFSNTLTPWRDAIPQLLAICRCHTDRQNKLHSTAS